MSSWRGQPPAPEVRPPSLSSHTPNPPRSLICEIADPCALTIFFPSNTYRPTLEATQMKPAKHA